MKKIFTLLFCVSMLCPTLFAELNLDTIDLDKDFTKNITLTLENQIKVSLDKMIIGEPKNVNRNYETKIMGSSAYPNSRPFPSEDNEECQKDYVEDGEVKVTDNYNLVIIYVPVNKSVMRQIDYNKISKKANFFFEDINRNYITLRDEKNTPVHFNLDYEFSFFSAKDNSYWANEDLDFRSPEGKILRLVIKYSPRYFTLTQSSTYTNPILSYTNSKGKTSSLYLEPNLENLQKDFKSIQDTKFIKISELK